MAKSDIIVNGCKFESSPFGPPPLPGVYFVTVISQKTHKKRVFYVGSSKNIRNRVSNQKHPYLKLYNRLSHIFWVVTETFITDNYIELEMAAIKQLNPVLNSRHKTNRNG